MPRKKLSLIFIPMCCLLLLLLPGRDIYAQGLDTAKIMKTDTVIKKKFWRASGELVLVELIPWSYNYFVRDAEFAHVTWSSIWHNMQFKNWEFDDNNFTTNQFAHPYHGNLYFNSFRSNGYSFWQSAPAALAGSYLWEVAGETHPAAPNDLINTTLGGISLGEMTHRVSNRIINKRKRGFGRQAQEFAAFLINPVGGFNRILDGKWGKVESSASETDLDTMGIVSQLDLGIRRIGEKQGTVDEKGKTGWYARIQVLYGDPFRESKTPFNSFDLVVEVGDDDSTKLNVVRVNGALSSWELQSNDRVDHILSLTMNYDFYHNSSFEYGGQSFNLSLYSKFILSQKTNIFTRFGIGAIVLAAVPDAYLYYGEGRDYDYGPGFSLIGSAGIQFANRFTAIVGYRGGWFATINGNPSNHFLHAGTLELRARLIANLSLAAEGSYFSLHDNYFDYPDVSRRYPIAKLALGFKF